MIFPPIYEFGTVMVFEPGVPNMERIVMRPTQEVDLSRFGVWAAWTCPDGSVFPVHNMSFWFGMMTVKPPCWIVVFTGKGEFRQLKHAETQEPVYCFHWGNDQTIFNFQQQVPILYRFDSFSVASHMAPRPVFVPNSPISKPESPKQINGTP